MTPGEFLKQLWQYKPEDQHVLVWTYQDKQSHWFVDVEQAGQFAAAVTGMDVYVGVGLSATDRGPSKRCTSDEVSGICGIGADLDFKSAAHANKPLPATLDQALSILPTVLPPTIIVLTGNGAQAWWLFKEPLMFANDQERTEAMRTVSRWHDMLGLRASAHEWAYDRLADLARVLRIPGTKNWKDRACPKEVRVHTSSDRRYNMSDIEEALDEMGIPDANAKEKAAQEWKERYANKPLVVNLKARIDQARIDAWMDPANSDARTAMRFKNTWDKQRHDLKDQTQSGYDMALANFGVEAGLSDQEIVDLIVTFRHEHGLKQRAKVDYFERTIAKAHSRTDPPPAPAPVPIQDQAVNDTDGNLGTGTPDPGTVKALLCERVSAVVGVPILRFVKISGSDPSYHIVLRSGVCIEIPSYEKLTCQEAVLNAIGKATDTLIDRMKPKEWKAIVRLMLDALVEKPGGDENDLKGSTRTSVAQYLQAVGIMQTTTDMPRHVEHKPVVIDSAIAIVARDFLAYLNKTATGQTVTVKAVTSKLIALGAVGVRYKSRPHRDQSRWTLPVDEFPPAEFCDWYKETRADDRD